MEIWVPYGEIESLLTVQAENLGELVDPVPESHLEEIAPRVEERMKGHDDVVVCDHRPATMRVLGALAARIPPDSPMRIMSPVAKRVEEALPELKGRVVPIPSLSGQATMDPEGEQSVMVSPEIAAEGRRRFVISTGAPDPLFGYVDSRVSLGLACTAGARRKCYEARESDDLKCFGETKACATMLEIVEKIPGMTFATIITRGGEPYSVIDGGAGDARGNYQEVQPSPAKGIIIGAGGRGYDETFSQSVRTAMGVLRAVRKGGEIVIIGECRDGIGSKALQMHSMGRITDAMLRKGFYEDGMEEIAYLARLRDQYSVTLVSSLPDLYAMGRFRFRTARNSAQALERVFASAGRGAKLHVFTRGPETLVSAR